MQSLKFLARDLSKCAKAQRAKALLPSKKAIRTSVWMHIGKIRIAQRGVKDANDEWRIALVD
jgi:hypothetical protein